MDEGCKAAVVSQQKHHACCVSSSCVVFLFLCFQRPEQDPQRQTPLPQHQPPICLALSYTQPYIISHYSTVTPFTLPLSSLLRGKTIDTQCVEYKRRGKPLGYILLHSCWSFPIFAWEKEAIIKMLQLILSFTYLLLVPVLIIQLSFPFF